MLFQGTVDCQCPKPRKCAATKRDLSSQAREGLSFGSVGFPGFLGSALHPGLLINRGKAGLRE